MPGLPDCMWQPPAGCTNESVYECIEGEAEAQCSGQNWYPYDESKCTSSCVHTVLLNPAPFYAIWRTGPRAFPWAEGAQIPHYLEKSKLKKDPVRKAFLNPKQILLGQYCNSYQIDFMGVSLFSPAYLEKANRLLASCDRSACAAGQPKSLPISWVRRSRKGRTRSASR